MEVGTQSFDELGPKQQATLMCIALALGGETLLAYCKCVASLLSLPSCQCNSKESKEDPKKQCCKDRKDRHDRYSQFRKTLAKCLRGNFKFDTDYAEWLAENV